MKRLIVARHAKSDWRAAVASDHERPLNARGRRAAPLVGLELARLGCVPDLVLCSTAVRTRQTWELMAPGFGDGPAVEHRRSLYLASTERVLAAIAGAPDDVKTLMVLGHNPSCFALTLTLARAGRSGAPLPLRPKFPTGAAAVFDLAADRWAAAGRGGELAHFVRPRDLA